MTNTFNLQKCDFPSAFLNPDAEFLLTTIRVLVCLSVARQKFHHSYRIIFTIGLFGQAVVFAFVLHHYYGLFQAAQGRIKFHTLRKVYGTVGVVVQQQQRRLYFSDVINR